MSAPVVTVRGSAQLEGPPDLATLSFTVHRSGPSADRVRAELYEASGRVDAVLAESAAAIERHTLTGLHIGPVFDRKSGTRITGYQGSCSTEIVVHDFAALGALVLGITAEPQSDLNGPWWSLRTDHVLHRQARLAAITDARQRADDYAAAFGAQVVDLLEVSDLEGGLTGGAREMGWFAQSRAAGAEPAFDFTPATQTVSGQVTVRFTISPPDLGPTPSVA